MHLPPKLKLKFLKINTTHKPIGLPKPNYRSVKQDTIGSKLIEEVTSAVRANKKNVTGVSIYEGKALIIQEACKMYTDALMGCQVFLLKTELKNGQTLALMTHYPPDSVQGNVSEIQRLIKQHEHLIDFTKRPFTTQVVPSENFRNDSIMFPKVVYAIDKEVAKQFPKGVDKSVITYNYDEDICNPYCFITNFPAKKGETISYSLVRELGNDSIHGNFGAL